MMPQIEQQSIQPFVHLAPPDEQTIAPSYTDTLSAAFKQENEVVNFYDMLHRQHFPADPNYNEVDALKQRGLLDQGEKYLGTSSAAELDAKIARVAQEEENKRVLAASGWAGYAAQVVAGAVSPTSAIPFYKGATGVKSILKGAASVLLGSAAQESILYSAQETRSNEDVAISLGASVILGGVLGAAGHTLRKSEFDKLASDMVRAPGVEAISTPMPFHSESTLSAAEVNSVNDVGKLSGLGAETLSRLPIAQNPIIRGLQQWNAPKTLRDMGGSSEVRRITSAFSQDGLVLDGNFDFRAASPGGNVEDLKKTYAVFAYKAHTAVEQAWKDYALGAGDTGMFSGLRSFAATQFDKTKMNFDEFKKQIALDIWTNFENPSIHPAVRKAAQSIDSEVFDKLYKEGVEVGIYTGNEKVVGDKRYVSRVYNTQMLMRRPEEFVKKIAEHYKQQLEQDYVKANEKLTARQQKMQGTLDAWQLSEADVNAQTTAVKQAQVDLTKSTPLDVQAAVDAQRELKKSIRDLTRQKEELLAQRIVAPADRAVRDSQLASIEAQLKLYGKNQEALRAGFGDHIDKYVNARKALDKRLDDLKKAFVNVDARMQRKLDKIVSNEHAQLDVLKRASAQLQKMQAMAASASDEELTKLASEAKTNFAKLAERFDNYDKKLLDANELDQADALAAKQDQTAERMTALADRIGQLDEFDRAAWRAELNDMTNEMLDVQRQVIERHTLRNERLWAQVEKMTPEARTGRAAALKEKLGKMTADFYSNWRQRGADFNGTVPDFSQAAEDTARDLLTKILGSERRLAYSDLIQAKRGPELARALTIPSTEILDFLETDIEKIIAKYTRTLGADISLARVFGSTTPEEMFSKITDEENRVTKALASDGKLEGKALENETQKVKEFYAQARKDLFVLYDRARGMRGVPQNPDSWAERGAKSLMDLNYLRMMGGVSISSIPDVARIVMKYGLTRTFKDAIVPMITNFQTIRLSQKEAKLAGNALDTMMHTRMYSMYDIFDEAHRGTALERGIHFMASRMGTWGLFDQWNAGIKQITAGVVNGKLMDSIASVMEGTGKVDEAKVFLAKNNITPDIAEEIWKQVTNGEGGGKVNGLWLPNTEAWDVTDPMVAKARRAYRAALNSEIDSTIVTPGFGKPAWMDANTLGRVIGQFKSYGLVSTQKVLMANLQQHDAAAVTGIAMSLGLGMLSYYLWAVAAGGKSYEEMKNASTARWVDEAISRSGVTGVFDEVQRVGQRIPLLKDYASFSGKGSTRHDNGGLVDKTLGPSFDALVKSTKIITQLDQPTKQTLHMIRLMLPLQNLFYLRQLFDKVEQASPLPDRRQ